ncbi:hypothetical protein [Rhodobacter capsulatus]|uniref:hypothetical protein n=1 Tax=Rhodobacter capsulatus TaxID=1061 RepID=UPI004024C703
MTDTENFRPRDGRTRLVVHFGGHKTGSSAIQETLHAANDPKNGFLLLFAGHPNSSAMMQNAFLRPEKLLSIRASEATRADLPAMRDGARRHLRRIILEGIETCPRGTLILSAESISSFVPEEAEAMVAFFQDLPVDPEFIGYIREPATYLRSSFQEILKLRMPLNPVFDPTGCTVLPLEHHAIVGILDRCVGPDRVQAHVYDRAGFPEGSVVRHFLSALGIDSGALSPLESNEGMSRLGVKLIYTYRRLGACPFANRGPRRLEHRFSEDLGRLPDVPFELHPEVLDQTRAVNREIFDWAGRRLGRPFPRAKGQIRDRDPQRGGSAALQRRGSGESLGPCGRFRGFRRGSFPRSRGGGRGPVPDPADLPVIRPGAGQSTKPRGRGNRRNGGEG